MDNSTQTRLDRARISLEGLSVGDAFGEGFFMSFEMAARLMASEEFGKPPFDFQDEFVLDTLIRSRRLFHRRPWRWTDDTALAVPLVAGLECHGQVAPRSLAAAFSAHYLRDPARGYGAAMHELLPRLAGPDWDDAALYLFRGRGSFGNGAAMRVAPLGAYFADDLDACVGNAALSARLTHAHPEGIAGAIAVAVAAAVGARWGDSGAVPSPGEYLGEVIPFIPEGEVRDRTIAAGQFTGSPIQAAAAFGSGDEVTAMDTVPFCLWCAAHYLDNYEEALWATVSGLGDRDTTCAIVGGIVACFTGTEGIPPEWMEAREALPASAA